MSRRIEFRAWGRGIDRVPSYAVVADDADRLEVVAAVARAIARANGAVPLSVVREDAGAYAFTFGSPTTGAVAGEAWFALGEGAERMPGEEFARRRKALGLTAKALGDEIGVAERTVYSWELGERRVPLWAERALARMARSGSARSRDGRDAEFVPQPEDEPGDDTG